MVEWAEFLVPGMLLILAILTSLAAGMLLWRRRQADHDREQ